MEKVATIILAGGEGKRLYPLTQDKAKPVVTFAGHIKLIDIPIHLSKKSKISKIFVLAQHLSHTLKDHIMQHYEDIEILSPPENQGILYGGTADAVRKNLDVLAHTSCSYFLILSGDQIYELDFEKLLEFAQEKDADCVVATLPVSKKDAPRLGILKVDGENRITEFVEKPQDKGQIDQLCTSQAKNKKRPLLGSMGIYLFKREALFSLLQEDPRPDFGSHLLPKQIQKQKTFSYIHDGYWEDIGTIGSYFSANLALTKQRASLKGHPLLKSVFPVQNSLNVLTKLYQTIICPGATIEAKEVRSSIIGSGSTVQKGCVLENCILCGKDDPHQNGAVVEENCLIKNAIIDKNAVVGRGSILINEKNLQDYDSPLLAVKEGIIIVKANSKIPEGFTL